MEERKEQLELDIEELFKECQLHDIEIKILKLISYFVVLAIGVILGRRASREIVNLVLYSAAVVEIIVLVKYSIEYYKTSKK